MTYFSENGIEWCFGNVQSIQTHNVQYNPLIGDGNSRAYATVNKSRPYGPVLFIRKEECVNHVTKRIGSNLRRLMKQYKRKTLEDGR